MGRLGRDCEVLRAQTFVAECTESLTRVQHKVGVRKCRWKEGGKDSVLG